MDDYSQSPLANQEGELYIGGVGVFAGYLGRDDLTSKALIDVNGELFYRTGDLVRMDANGMLHYIGRKDHQVKLRGQRIELGEIERCLLNMSIISACVVIKWNEDHLVAYIQSSHLIEEQQLRQHCQSHLPPHMIPSFFIILEQLPLNANGKIDRKHLPSPQFPSSTSSKYSTNVGDEFLQPTNDIEQIIHKIWCDIFHQNQISINTNIFTIGGHSLLVMQLFHRYKIEFHLESSSLSIFHFFQYPTIAEHAHFIHQTLNIIIEDIDHHHHQWSTLHLTQAKASYAQERIFLDEHIRFFSSSSSSSFSSSSSSSSINASHHYNIYAIPLLYRLSSHNTYVSIFRLRHAFQSLISKHNILRTALYLNDANGSIVQERLDVSSNMNDMISCRFTVVNLDNDDDDDDRHRRDIVHNILIRSDLFDLSQGYVINCHLLRHYRSSSSSSSSLPDNDDLLTTGDWILFTLHHAAFDGASRSIFLRDLALAYDQNENFLLNTDTLQYIDYSVYEHCMDMTLSCQFWRDQLQGYDFQRHLSLPLDRHRSSTDQRSHVACTVQLIFDDDICTSFLHYASSHHLTFFQLGLATFYTFLFKLTHGHRDLCVASINANRYRNEILNIIGMFVSTLPYRLHIDDHHWSFDELVRHVQEKCLSILEHSHYPLQEILSQFHVNQSNAAFLDMMFDLITVSSEHTQLSLDRANLEQLSLEETDEMAKFDSMFTLVYDSTSHVDRLSCVLVCSQDVFEQSSVVLLSQRLRHFYQQLFSLNLSVDETNSCRESIWKLDLILPEEASEISDVLFCQQSNIVNEAPASYAQARIWLDERLRFDPENPQVAIYNMPFVYRLSPDNTLSIQRFHRALQLVVDKHPSLHTSLIFDTQNNQLIQRITSHKHSNNKTMFSFTQSSYETDEQLNNIMHDERKNTQHFDLAQGLVFRCHLIHYKEIISSNDLLSHKDLLIFNFHHALFDFPSMNIFLHDLNQAYTTSQLSIDQDNTTLRYLDYAVIEQQMSMTGAQMYWYDTLYGCQLDQPLSLPYDRYRLSNEHRTGRGIPISFNLGQDLSHEFITYASSNNIELGHLALAIYYLFLFKISNGEKDLCIGINTDDRYRDEFQSIIGMFVNAIPLRCQLDPSWCFHQLLDNVRSMTTNCMKYSYYPLQHILNQHPHVSHPAFLDISFEFISSMGQNDENEVMIGDSRLCTVSFVVNINEDEVMSKFDFIVNIHHQMMTNELSCMMSHPQKLAVELDDQSLTYAELLYYVQLLSSHLLTHYNILPGEVIGMMAIEMVGGVYCPLSPRDPQHRLHALVQQTQARLVLVHWLTKEKLQNDVTPLDIDLRLIVDYNKQYNVVVHQLSDVVVTPKDVAYVIFTSGSTGIPKAVQVRHENFTHCMRTLTYINNFNTDDIAVQMARCSFDIHVQEIFGILTYGATLVMLHPRGTMDLNYLASVLYKKQTTYMHAVPSLLHSFFTFLEYSNACYVLKFLRSLCSS
ncbi:hypothetical protein I4U23_027303, partial [Adineta vaga]